MGTRSEVEIDPLGSFPSGCAAFVGQLFWLKSVRPSMGEVGAASADTNSADTTAKVFIMGYFTP